MKLSLGKTYSVTCMRGDKINVDVPDIIFQIAPFLKKEVKASFQIKIGAINCGSEKDVCHSVELQTFVELSLEEKDGN